MTTTVVLADLAEYLDLAVREVVRDWAAVGLLAPSVWVDLGQLDTGGWDVPVLRVAGTETVSGQLFDVLAGEGDVRVVCLVSSPGVQDRQAAVTALCTRLFHDLGSARVDRRMVLAPDATGRALPSACVWSGWTCHLLLPEDAPGPSGVTAPVTERTEPGRAIGHVASGLVSIAGLWRGVPAPSPPPTVGAFGQLRATRTYVRRVDADPAVERLVARLLDAEPRDRVPRDRVVAPVTEAVAAARAVLATHPDLVDHHPYPMPPAPAARDVTAGEALRMLWEHLTSALSNAPSAMVSGVRARASSTVATAVHHAVFGTGPEADTVVSVDGQLARTAETAPALDRTEPTAVFGAAADGESAAAVWAREAADVRRRTMEAANRPLVPVPPATALWRDVVATGVALVDGGTAGAEGSGARDGSRAAVVVELSAVTPPPDESVVLDDVLLGQEVEVAATDVYGVLTAREIVAALPVDPPGEDGEPSPSARRRTEALAIVDRTRNTRSHGYLWTLGTHLHSQLENARADLESFRARTPGSGGETDRTRLAEAEARLRRRARQLLVGLVLCVPLGWLLAKTDRFNLVEAVSIAVAVAGVLVLMTLWSFMAVQRILFQLEHQLRAGNLADQHLPLALAHLVSEQARLAQLNAQCTAWGRVLSDDVHRPFGTGSNADPLPDVDLGGTLPRSVVLGTGCGMPLDRVVADLANRFYRPGWLATLLEARRGAVLRELAAQRGLAEVPDPAADTLRQPNGALGALVAAVDRPEVHVRTRQRGRCDVISLVGGMGFTDLVPLVRDGSGERSSADFFDELLAPHSSIRPFSQGHLSAAGAARSHVLTPVERTEVLASATTLVPELPGAVVTRAALPAVDPDGEVPITTENELDQLVVRIDLACPTSAGDYRFFDTPDDVASPVAELTEGSFL